jgi:hypothetical protein
VSDHVEVWSPDPVTGRWRVEPLQHHPRIVTFDNVLAFCGVVALVCAYLLGVVVTFL